jgi:hypothetical protein
MTLQGLLAAVFGAVMVSTASAQAPSPPPQLNAVTHTAYSKNTELFAEWRPLIGVSTPEGEFVLVGNSGEYDAVRSGPSLVWVGRYDAGGALKTEITFPGRYGSITRSGDGGYALVYDKSSSVDQEIHVKGLSAEAKELWDAPLQDGARSVSEFKIAALSRGGYVVAGRKTGRPYVALLDGTGRTVATLDGVVVERSIDLGDAGLAYAGASLYVASSHIEARTRSDVRQTVRVRKVGL